MGDLIKIKGSRYFFKRITETAQKPPKDAQFIIKNPFDQDSIILGIGMVPDTNFQGTGILEILFNKTLFFEQSLPGEFTGVFDLNIPIPEKIGLVFQRTETLEFKIFSGSGASVGLVIGVLVGESEDI